MNSLSNDQLRELALSVYDAVLRETESFQEDCVGADLAYLLGAILRNNPDVAFVDCSDNAVHETLLAALENNFPPGHMVWEFIRREASHGSPPPPRVGASFEKRNLVEAALSRCQSIESKSLEEFLDSLLDQDLDVLANLPGTPGQVLAAQFACYVRSSVTLSEELRRVKTRSQPLIETIHRLPEFKARCRSSRSPNHDPAASDPEASA